MFTEIISILITLLLAFLSFLFPEQGTSFYIIWILLVLMGYLISICVRLYLQNRASKEKLRNIANKHFSLTESYKESQAELQKYQAWLASMEYMLAVSVQSTDTGRLSILYRWFMDNKIDTSKHH